ncbi:TPA: nucleotide sugar dehydrogenase [Candidatus Woesearchaeota archaeon]|nr:nucleotide sugar dehydrogenase [Candidatus Woesearchaeota archaeon]HIH48333.1 nucleotide sugar dehydrogenase [Candidatus Woesearchaeota archaeon]HIJ03127.1 nucleotide sugar dehydrogenase [Candidatus Woesearchaeota archaeon]
MKSGKDMFTICVVGLGYVGMPLAVALSKKYPVIGFDVDKKKIAAFRQNINYRSLVEDEEFLGSKVSYTDDPEEIKKANFIIVAVPTPIDSRQDPDLTLLKGACRVVGEHLSKGSIVVFESTVYPGVTEEICLPILEQQSGLSCPVDFKIGYSPERINPGDKQHTLSKIVKVVSGCDKESLEVISQIYSSIIDAGIHQAQNIKTAEAAKIIENIQRDLNIALMNELAIIFHKMDINTKEVLDAAGTKWNFHKYTPGLVGGHCIGVDPYYLTYKAKMLGYDPKVILAGRGVNESMSSHVVLLLEEALMQAGKDVKSSTIFMLGLTFKENVNDPRNSKAAMIISLLKSKGVLIKGYDPLLEDEVVMQEFGIENTPLEKKGKIDAIILFSPHEPFRKAGIKALCEGMPRPVLIDIKGVFDYHEAASHSIIYRCL